jgi:hypothetical protein
MKTIKRIFISVACALMLGLSFTSCSENNFSEGTNGNKEVKISLISPDFTDANASSAKSRALVSSETNRVILEDGLLVDGTLTGCNDAVTRVDEHQTISSGNGIIILCESGSTTIAANPQVVTLNSGSISFTVPDLNKSYDVYIYWAENGGLSENSISSVTVGTTKVTEVTLPTRDAGAADDYGMITLASGTLTGAVHLTPIGSKIKMTMNAGVAPITGFATTITSYGMTSVGFTGGNYTVNTASSTKLDMTLSGSSYLTTGSSDYCTRYIPDNSSANGAIVNVVSITGPNGTSTVTKTYDASKNTMYFKNTYANGYRYNLNLDLATPIYGYEEVGTDGVATNVVKDDVAGTACITGMVTTDAPTVKCNYSGSAAWPVMCGRPQLYAWDAKAYYYGTNAASGNNSYCNTTPIATDFSNPGTQVAANSCKYCPTYNQALWYLSAGIHRDDSRWYCPNGRYITNPKDIIVHTGGSWIKKISTIANYDPSTIPTSGIRSVTNGYKTTTFNYGKPGVKIKIPNTAMYTDLTTLNPNDWFFLPAAGVYSAGHLLYNGDDTTTHSEGHYWLSTPGNDSFQACHLLLTYTYAGVYTAGNRVDAYCLWNVQ